MYTRVIVAGWNLCGASNELGLVTINSCYFRFRQYEDDVDPGRNIGTSIMTLRSYRKARGCRYMDFTY